MRLQTKSTAVMRRLGRAKKNDDDDDDVCECVGVRACARACVSAMRSMFSAYLIGHT